MLRPYDDKNEFLLEGFAVQIKVKVYTGSGELRARALRHDKNFTALLKIQVHIYN